MSTPRRRIAVWRPGYDHRKWPCRLTSTRLACRRSAFVCVSNLRPTPDAVRYKIVDLNASNVMRDPQTAEPWIQKFQ